MSGRMSRSQALNILSRGESDEVTEETSEEEGESLPHQLPVQFKSTYPIDAPLGRRLFTNTNGVLRTSKVSSAVRTYPVDEKCCDASEPCFDHSLPKSLLPSSPSARPNLNSARNPEIESQWKVAPLMLLIDSRLLIPHLKFFDRSRYIPVFFIPA